MFVDELEIKARAGDGGDGVIRWRREKYIPKGGPAGGNGGKGGDVYVRAVQDLALLAKYRGAKEFDAGIGLPGGDKSMHGRDGDDRYIDIPVGATIYEDKRDRVYTLMKVGETTKILLGGAGGLGNEYFKSSTNRTPEKATSGKKGEEGVFRIELSLLVDVGLIGLPNAGKSTLLNALTNASARVGEYPFTTLEPHLGDLYGYTLADIPGLIEGASEGKGLGHKFLKHIKRTRTLLHCISLESENPMAQYELVRSELKNFDALLLEKEEWIILTKSDISDDAHTQRVLNEFNKDTHSHVHVVSSDLKEGVKELSDALTTYLKE